MLGLGGEYPLVLPVVIHNGERRASLLRERELVHRMVVCRFGPDTAEELIPLLDRLSEPGSIVNIADAVVECGTAEEFLKRVREA